MEWREGKASQAEGGEGEALGVSMAAKFGN